MNEDLTLRISFGKEQGWMIDKLLKSMSNEGGIMHMEKGTSNTDLIPYLIEFKTPYHLYIFGHRQASIFSFFGLKSVPQSWWGDFE